MLKFLTSQDTWPMRNILIIFLHTHKSKKNHTVHNLFNISHIHTIFKPHRTRIQNTQSAVYISNTPVTLKQSQGHETYSDNVDPKQGYDHAKFERSCFHDVWEKAKKFFFEMRELVNYLPWICVIIKKDDIFMMYSTILWSSN